MPATTASEASHASWPKPRPLVDDERTVLFVEKLQDSVDVEQRKLVDRKKVSGSRIV